MLPSLSSKNKNKNPIPSTSLPSSFHLPLILIRHPSILLFKKRIQEIKIQFPSGLINSCPQKIQFFLSSITDPSPTSFYPKRNLKISILFPHPSFTNPHPSSFCPSITHCSSSIHPKLLLLF